MKLLGNHKAAPRSYRSERHESDLQSGGPGPGPPSNRNPRVPVGAEVARTVVLAMLVAVTASAVAGAAPLIPQAFVDRTPAGMPLAALCAVDLGAADAVAWLGSGARGGRRLQAASVASASGGSGRPTAGPLEEVTGAGGCPVAAASADGAALLAYTEGLDIGDELPVRIAERPVGGPLGPPLPLAGAVGGQVAVARAPGGAAIVAWLQRERIRTDDASGRAMRFRVVASVRPAGATFGPPVALGEPGQARSSDGYTPAVGIDRAGNAVVVWSRPVTGPSGEMTTDELWMAHRPAAGAFGPAERIGGDRSGNLHAQLAVAPTGEALLLTQDNRGIALASGSAADGFGASMPLGSASAGDGEPVLAVVSGGAAVVGWLAGIAGEPGTAGAMAISRTSGGSPFTAPRALVVRPPRIRSWKVSDLRLAVASDGRALMTWMGAAPAAGGSGWVPFASLGEPGGAWAPAQRVTSGCRPPIAAQPAFGRYGRPRVSMLSSAVADGGDYFVPVHSRLRTVAFGNARPADRTAPRLRLAAPAAQTLPRWRYQRDRGVRARVRCSEACDVNIGAEVLRRGPDATTDGFYPAYPRLRAGGSRALTLHTTDALYWGGSAPLQAGDTIPVRITAHACDAAGNVSHATTRVRVTLPHDVYPKR